MPPRKSTRKKRKIEEVYEDESSDTSTSSPQPHPPSGDREAPKTTIQTHLLQFPQPNMIDLKMLHHFTTSTYSTLSTRGDVKTLWRVTIPQLAFSHELLTRAILAVSALHLARLDRSHHALYYPYARSQYLKALRSSTAESTPQIHQLTCHAELAFFILLLVFQLGRPSLSTSQLLLVTPNHHPNTTAQEGSELALWIHLLTSIRRVIDISPSLESGPLASLLRFYTTDEHSTFDLDENMGPFVTFLAKEQSESPNLPVYMDAIDRLRETWTMRGEVFMVWAVQLDASYFHLLRERDPVAWVIFAHFCVLLHRGHTLFWVMDWPEKVIANVHELLPESYRIWMRWPLEEMGLAT